MSGPVWDSSYPRSIVATAPVVETVDVLLALQLPRVIGPFGEWFDSNAPLFGFASCFIPNYEVLPALAAAEGITVVVSAEMADDWSAEALLTSIDAVGATIAADMADDWSAAVTARVGGLFIVPELNSPRVARITHDS